MRVGRLAGLATLAISFSQPFHLRHPPAIGRSVDSLQTEFVSSLPAVPVQAPKTGLLERPARANPLIL